MVRVTRSKKVDIVEDQTATSSGPKSPAPSASEKVVLSPNGNATTARNISPEDALLDNEVKNLKAAYRNALGGGKKVKKGKAKKKEIKGSSAETLDNGVASLGSEDVAETPSDLPPSYEETSATSIEKATASSAPLPRTTRRQAQTQAAEEALSKTVREGENTKTLGPLHTESPKHTQNAATPMKSTSTAPAKTPKKTLEEVEKACEQSEIAPIASEGSEDSFVQEITCRSPAKAVTRIEDSVEALDNLEDALEALGEATLAEKIVSPKKPTTTASPTRLRDSREYLKQKVETKPENKTMKKASVSNGQQTKPGYATVRARPTAPKAAPALKRATSLTVKPKPKVSEEYQKTSKAPIKRPISMIMPREITKSTKPVTVSTFELPGEAVARRLKEQREARLLRQSSEDNVPTVSVPKIKSTKPATKSTFELPGEAVSRRKREAHEARLKAQEEDAQRRREFKAKPVRASVVPSYVPRETAASLARRSKIEVEPLEDGILNVSKRGSIVGAHRLSILQLNVANMSAPRALGTAIPASRNPSSSTQGTSQRVVSAQEIHAQRQRAKEIYSRDAMVAEDIERERLEREAAAKRAREEAAERGRQASREWAARQLVKKMADKTDKGLSPGYGPGGQLGLKS